MPPRELELLMKKGDPILFLPLHFQEVVLALLVIRLPEQFQEFRLLNSFHISLNHTMGILQSQEVLRQALEKLRKIYSHDYLTGILNRGGFFAETTKLIQKGSERNLYLWIISIDLNGLKEINDMYGHHEGDFAFCKVAQTMTACADEETLCSRFGGDEFTACGLALDPDEACMLYSSRFRKYLDQFNANGKKITRYEPVSDFAAKGLLKV